MDSLVETVKAAARCYSADDYKGAWVLANQALAQEMDHPGALYLAGQCALAWNMQGLAGQLFRRACAIRPDNGHHWVGYGVVLLDLRRFEESEECFRRAMELLGEDNSLLLANMATLMLNQGRAHEAIEWAQKSLALEHRPMVNCTIGFANLMLKQWGPGFDGFVWNVTTKGRKRRVYRIPEEPDWDGTPGQTVVVQCEQGLGDEIAAMSVLPDLVRDCKQVIVDTHPKLHSLFSRSFQAPNLAMYPTRKQSDLKWPLEYQIDATVQVSTLGKWYRRSDEAFPRKPWLVPDPARRAMWREWLDNHPGQKCGIAWTGGTFLTNRMGRSASLEDMAPVMLPGATYVSLQYQDCKAEVDEWNAKHPSAKIVIPPVDEDNYDDTVSLLAELDHVMSVTTTVVHACGAIGRQCWCIVPAVITSAQWRYGLEGDDMIWYPPNSVSLYRQRKEEASLAPAIRRMAKDWRKIMRLRDAA